jgi:nitrite reductase/ring-hydroxylating ferredoxin subunit
MTWHPTSIAARLPQDPRPIPATVGGRAIVLVPWEDAWYALEDRCSHAGCAFSDDGAVEDGHLVCDCHGSEFDLRTGAVRRPPARNPVRAFEVRTRDGSLEVDVP